MRRRSLLLAEIVPRSIAGERCRARAEAILVPRRSIAGERCIFSERGAEYKIKERGSPLFYRIRGKIFARMVQPRHTRKSIERSLWTSQSIKKVGPSRRFQVEAEGSRLRRKLGVFPFLFSLPDPRTAPEGEKYNFLNKEAEEEC